MQNNKLDFTFIKLNEHDRHLHTSYIRKTTPDYLLSVRGPDLHIKISDDSEKPYSFPIDCCFFLNYGDLFLSAINASDCQENVEKLMGWIACFLIDTKEKLDTEIKNAAPSKNGRILDSSFIQELNDTYMRYEQALSFAAITLFALHEEQSKSESFFDYALGELLSLPSDQLQYGALSAAEFQENLKKRNLFSEISVTIRYRDDGDEYSFSDFFSLIGYEVRQLIGQNREIKVCENCGRFFIPSNRRDEKYCDNIFRGFKTCKQVAFSRRLDNDEALKEYRKIYKSQHARKQRNGSNIVKIDQYFERWSVFAKSKLVQCQNGEISLEEMVNSISGKEWMQGKI